MTVTRYPLCFERSNFPIQDFRVGQAHMVSTDIPVTSFTFRGACTCARLDLSDSNTANCFSVQTRLRLRATTLSHYPLGSRYCQSALAKEQSATARHETKASRPLSSAMDASSPGHYWAKVKGWLYSPFVTMLHRMRSMRCWLHIPTYLFVQNVYDANMLTSFSRPRPGIAITSNYTLY